jgi:conjugative relaxase-like TrwC/TraI family protein
VTISPRKSVSLAALVEGDGRLLQAHDRAVEKALSELERHAQAVVARDAARDVAAVDRCVLSCPQVIDRMVRPGRFERPTYRFVVTWLS